MNDLRCVRSSGVRSCLSCRGTWLPVRREQQRHGPARMRRVASTALADLSEQLW